MYLRTAEGLGLDLGQPAPAPDSPIANVFVQAHRARWCVPGQANSTTCRNLAAPRPVRRVVIHTLTSAAPRDCRRFGTVNDVVRAWQRRGESSSHYLVDRNGHITQMVREADVAFHAEAANSNSIGIEHADVCNVPDPYTTQLYERSAALVRDIAARNGFPIRVFGFDTNNRNNATVIGHQILDPAGRDDAGPYWDWEYYASLLRWDGRTPGTRPIRRVVTAPPASAAPQGWQVQSRVQVHGERRACIPNEYCANRYHSYSDHYWRATPNTAGSDVVFQLSLFEFLPTGRYKISLWWPNVRNANAETQVRVVLTQTGLMQTGSTVFDDRIVNQRTNFGQWNDIGYTFTVPSDPYFGVRVNTTVSVQVRRTSNQAGWILADAARLLKVG